MNMHEWVMGEKNIEKVSNALLCPSATRQKHLGKGVFESWGGTPDMCPHMDGAPESGQTPGGDTTCSPNHTFLLGEFSLLKVTKNMPSELFHFLRRNRTYFQLQVTTGRENKNDDTVSKGSIVLFPMFL